MSGLLKLAEVLPQSKLETLKCAAPQLHTTQSTMLLPRDIHFVSTLFAVSMEISYAWALTAASPPRASTRSARGSRAAQ